MSSIDTSIYAALLRPAKSVADYDNEALALQQNRLAVQMAQSTMADKSRAVEDGNRLRQAVSGFGADTKENYNALLKAGQLKAAQEYQKTNADAAESEAKASKSKVDLIDAKLKQSREYLATVKTPEQYIAWHEANHRDPILGPELAARGVTAEQARSSIMESIQQPGGLEQLLQRSALGIEKFTEMNKPTLTTRDLGGTSQVLSTPGLGGAPTVLRSDMKTQSPDSVASTAASRYSADSSARSAGARLKFDKEQAVGAGPDASDAMIDAIGTGKMAPPTGYALRNPKILAMMERVAQKYPEYDATEYAAKSKAMRDFSSGTPGNSIRSFAVATDHLGQLKGLITALENKDTPLINKYGNIIAQQTGSAAPTNFDAAKGIVAKEVLKSIVAGGGGVEERQELAHLLDNAKTTKQLNGVVDTYLHLMTAQKSGLERQYELSTGRKDAATRFNYKLPENGAASAVPKVVNAADYAKVPSGAEYITPDGHTRRKP